MSPRLLPLSVDPNWHCQQSGDCCTLPDFVTMHEQEQAALLAYAEKHLPIRILTRLNFVTHSPGFVSLLAHPCPLYDRESRTCMVYEARPYNCRRFACMRPDIKAEPLRLAPISPVLRYGTIGCANTRERLLQSRVARRLFETIQRHAARWARSHGWSD